MPAGVDDAAYVKAGFLTAITKGDATSPLISKVSATELLATMLGGYNIEALVDLLDDPELAPVAAKGLSKTLLMFDAFHDVVEKSKTNEHAKSVVESWANAEWFLNKPKLAEQIKVTVFKVDGETNTDDLSPAGDAWSRPDIPLHALAMLKNTMDKPLRTFLANVMEVLCSVERLPQSSLTPWKMQAPSPSNVTFPKWKPVT